MAAAQTVFALAAICASGQTGASLQRAIGLHQAGQVEAALPLYREFLREHPESVDGLANYGAALAHEGSFEEAIAQYEKALRIQPGNPQVQLNLALSFYKTGRYSEAKDRFTVLAPLLPPFSPQHRQVSFLLADCELRLGQYKAAAERLEPWEKRAPDDLTLAYLLGTALIRDHQTERGAMVLDRILRRGDSAEAQLLMGTAKLNSLDFTGARDEFEKAIRLNPALPEAHASLGLALLGLSQADAAESAFHKALELDPHNFTAALQSGILARQNHRYEVARVLLEKSLRLRPGDSGVRYQLALTAVAMGRTDEGRSALEALVRDEPKFVEAHVSLAGVYYKLKRKEDGDRERAIVRDLNAESQARQPGNAISGAAAK